MTATHLTDRLPFSPGITAATAVRVLQQISRDRGSTALLLGIPCMLMVLLKLMFHDSGRPSNVSDRRSSASSRSS